MPSSLHAVAMLHLATRFAISVPPWPVIGVVPGDAECNVRAPGQWCDPRLAPAVGVGRGFVGADDVAAHVVAGDDVGGALNVGVEEFAVDLRLVAAGTGEAGGDP